MPVFVAGELVREYLIDHPVLVPLRHLSLPEYCYLVAVRIILVDTSLAAQIVLIIAVIKDLPVILAFGLYLESVPEQAALIRHGDTGRESAVTVVFHLNELRIGVLAVPKHQLDALRLFIFYIKRKRDFRPCFRCPEGLSVLFQS